MFFCASQSLHFQYEVGIVRYGGSAAASNFVTQYQRYIVPTESIGTTGTYPAPHPCSEFRTPRFGGRSGVFPDVIAVFPDVIAVMCDCIAEWRNQLGSGPIDHLLAA